MFANCKMPHDYVLNPGFYGIKFLTIFIRRYVVNKSDYSKTVKNLNEKKKKFFELIGNIKTLGILISGYTYRKSKQAKS